MEKLKRNLKQLVNRMMELWDGKSSDDKDKKKQGQKQQGGGGSVVSVSQPISRGGMPTHSPSRADYLNSPNAQTQFYTNVTTCAATTTTTFTPTQQVPQQNNTQEQYSNLPLEPAAYNSGGGGSFATF